MSIDMFPSIQPTLPYYSLGTPQLKMEC